MYLIPQEHFQSIFGTKYDVLSFLYSVVLTKGPNMVISERQDMDEPLIGIKLENTSFIERN